MVAAAASAQQLEVSVNETIIWTAPLMAMATPISDSTIRVKLMSFNMHGFHQGCPVLDDMIELFNPAVLLLQEHWLTPANLN